MDQSNRKTWMGWRLVEFSVFTAQLLWLLQHKASVWDSVCLGTSSNVVFICDALHDLSTCVLRVESYWLTFLLEESEQKQCSYCFSKMWWTFEVIMSMSYLDPNCDSLCVSTIGDVEPLWKPWRFSILGMSFCFFWFPSYMIDSLMPSFCHCQLFNKHLFRVYFKIVIW